MTVTLEPVLQVDASARSPELHLLARFDNDGFTKMSPRSIQTLNHQGFRRCGGNPAWPLLVVSRLLRIRERAVLNLLELNPHRRARTKLQAQDA